MGSTAAGASALVGTGAFSRVESHRQVSIEVANDTNAYLGLDACHKNGSKQPNGSYTETDGRGHLTIEMDSNNSTANDGQGVNSDSFSWFNEVFQMANQGKDDVGVSIDTSGAGIGTVDLPDHGTQDRVQFYVGDGAGDISGLNRIDNGSPHNLSLGTSLCVGILVISKGLSDGDTLVNGDVQITADVDDYSSSSG